MVLLFLREIIYDLQLFFIGVYFTLESLILKFKNKCELVTRSGDVAVITGGARGLGAHVVEKLLKCDYHVIIGCRNTGAGASLVREIRDKGIKTGSTTILQLDMASMDSITTFAQAVLRTRPKINLLINNAGIMAVPYKETEDGYESQWAVNYLGHFLLTHLLLQSMHESPDRVRIVNVSSCAHVIAKDINFSDINMTNDYMPNAAYAQSKIAQIIFTRYLDQRLRDINSKVQVFAVHPGVVDTDLIQQTLHRRLFFWILPLIIKSPEEGSRSIVYACLSDKLENKGGEYISDCRITTPKSTVYDTVLQKKLFAYSMEKLKIEKFGNLIEL